LKFIEELIDELINLNKTVVNDIDKLKFELNIEDFREQFLLINTKKYQNYVQNVHEIFMEKFRKNLPEDDFMQKLKVELKAIELTKKNEN
ncbi:hypothetical protein Mgra_00009990, partial [Meloidogyne graminicola]